MKFLYFFASLSPVGMLPGSALQTLPSAMAAHPLPIPWDAVPKKQQWCEKHRVELREEVSPSPAESCPRGKELSWRELNGKTGVRSSYVEWGPASKAAAWKDMDNLASRGLLIVASLLPCAWEQESWLWEQLPSLFWQPLRNKPMGTLNDLVFAPAATES